MSGFTKRSWLVLLVSVGTAGAALLPAACIRQPICGDGRIDEEVGEECDDGNALDTDDCTNECKLAQCGDGFLQAGNNEQCDDANDVSTDGCTNTCLLPVCGDGAKYEGVEECDDGNISDTDDCLTTCLLATCGDGVVNLATGSAEECDDGNDDSTDNCTTECKKPACGDGFVQDGEDCDDGNTENDDACPATCKAPVCGDGFLDPTTEECDDGNQVETDTCLSTCKSATCGDSVLEVGVEECDDGNVIAGDFCSPTCQKECFGDAAALFEGRCYIYFPGPLAWNDANCNAFGMHLATIESAAENTEVQNLLPNGATDAWIGLTDQAVESAWFWQLDAAGNQLLFPALLKWAAGQPDNTPAEADCAVIQAASGLWTDESCAAPRGFVCEHEW